MGHKTDKKILCKRFQTSTLNSKMCLFVCKYLRLLSKTNLEFKRASKRSSQQASAWRDFRLFELIYMLRKVVYLRIFCNGENWLTDKKKLFQAIQGCKIRLQAMQPSNNYKGKSCSTQKGSTWRSQIFLQAMQLSSNSKGISCSTQKGSTWRSQISLWAMQPTILSERKSFKTHKGSTWRSQFPLRAMQL